MYKFEKISPIIIFILSAFATLSIIYSDHRKALADIVELKENKDNVLSSLEKVNEKLNVINGKLSILLKDKGE